MAQPSLEMGMSRDAANLPEHVSAPPLEARPVPPSDDPVAASLRGFGPLGLLAIRVSIVVLTSALFALGHYSNLGLPGVEQAMITGLVFGTIFSVTGRIWMVMCTHAAFDLAAVAIIYWNLEADIAHLIFK